MSLFKGLFGQFKQHWNTYKVMNLYSKGSYSQIAKYVNNYEKYKTIKIAGYPLVLFMIQQQNISCLKAFLDVDYKQQVLNEQIKGILLKPFHFAYLKNNSEINSILQQNGFKIDHVDEHKRNILHYAAMHNNISLILKGIDNSLDINSKDKQDKTPLHYAAINGKKQTIKTLLELQAKEDILDINNKYPLHYAILSEDYQTFQILFNKSQLLNFFQVQQIIHTACQQNNVKILSDILKKNKGNVFRIDKKGLTPLHYGAINKNLNILHLLFNYSAIIDQTDNFGFTPLHLAVLEDNADVVIWLIQKGANLHIKAQTGFTAIDSAMMMKDSKVYKILKKHDESINKI